MKPSAARFSTVFLLSVFIASCAPKTWLSTSTNTQDITTLPTLPSINSTRTAAIPSQTPTSLPTWTIAPLTFTPTPSQICRDDVCNEPGDFWLSRPINPQYNDRVDPLYRFGMTQQGYRMVHSGVEFVNLVGTPVLAAGNGVVEYAGTDQSVPLGPQYSFYGNVIVLKHIHPGTGSIFFTLYGHLSEIEVKTGDTITSGQEIGKVGLTGVAEGAHLHFEVRKNENKYLNAVNPELYLLPPVDSLTQEMDGVLLIRLFDSLGNRSRSDSITIKSIQTQQETYSEMYAPTVTPDPTWLENLVIGDLPAGQYLVSTFKDGQNLERTVIIESGRLTTVDFHAQP